MALEAFVAGRYSGTYNSVDVGPTDEGYELQQESMWEPVSPSDTWGDSIVDGVYRGGNCHLQFLSKTYKAGAITPFWPWGTLGVMQAYGAGGTTPIGRLASAVAAAMILTAQPNSAYNTASATAVATFTASKSILAPNFNGTLLFHSKLRKVPIRLFLLPSDTTVSTTTTTSWFSTS